MDSNCNCHHEISEEAKLVIRTEQYQLTPEILEKVAHFKETIAKLFTQVNEIPAPNTSMVAFMAASEAIVNAKHHLQLASYFITHALTSNGVPDNAEALSTVE